MLFIAPDLKLVSDGVSEDDHGRNRGSDSLRGADSRGSDEVYHGDNTSRPQRVVKWYPPKNDIRVETSADIPRSVRHSNQQYMDS